MSRVVNPRLALLRQSPVTVAPSRGAIVSSQPVEEIRTLPASVGPGDRLYATLGSTSYDLTAAVEGDRVRVPYGARLTCVSSSGETRWTEENRGVRPSGDLGGREWSTVPRIKLRLANFCEGYTLSAVGWPSLNEVPYPENSPTDDAAPWLTSSDPGSLGSAGTRCGTYNVGFPEEITPRVLLVRYGPHTVGSFAVRPDPTTGIANIDLNAIPTAALRLVGLPPNSRVMDANNVDITTNRPSGGDGGWERVGGNAQGAWVIGVPSSTRSVKIRYPNGRDLTVAVPPTLLRGVLSVNVPPQPAIPRARVRLVFPQVTPARVFAVNSSGARGEDVTLFAQPDGTNATWDGSTWVFGIPLDTMELNVRDERSGQVVRLALPAGARTAGETITVNFPQPNAGMGGGGGGGLGSIRTNPAQRFEARIRFPSPQAARMYLASGDTLGEEVTASAPPSGVAPQWVGSAWVIGLPVGTRRIAVVFADGVRQFVDLPAVAQGQSVTVDLPPRPGATAENMVNLRIENAAPGDRVFVGEADATTWSLANGGAATYDAATRVRTIGIPNTTTSVRVRTTDGVVRSFTVPPPVSGVSTLRIPAPDVAPTRKDVRAMGFVQGAKLFVDGIEVTNATLTNGQPAGWADAGRTQWNFSVPSAARSVTIEYPSRASRTLPITTAPGLSGGYYEVIVPVDTTALGGGSGDGNLLSVARRIKVRLSGIPASFAPPAAPPQVMFVGQNIASAPLPNGAPASVDVSRGGRGVPGEVSMEFGFDFNPAITQEFTVIAGNDRRQFDVRAADIVPDPTDALHFMLPLSWSGATDMSYPGSATPPRPGSLANVRIWMIDPPAGTYAIAKNAAGEERRLDGPTTQLSAAAVLNPSDMPNGIAPLAGNASDVVWVTEGLFPDGSGWTTATASIVLPNGTRLPVSLSPVPQDGILRVQLSSYPGARPTQSSTGSGPHTASAGGGIGFGTVAVVGGAAAALWYYRKSLGRFLGNG